MIVVTGGAGFIGSNVVKKLNDMGEEHIVIVDELEYADKWKNLNGLKYAELLNKDDFIQMIVDDSLTFYIDSMIHLGACSSTTETDADYLISNNLQYSIELVKYCLPRKTRFIYASSAATYGDGSKGYVDGLDILEDLRPLNMYGYSKHMFDQWVKRMKLSDKVVGLKYFNVFGPNEYHKDDMRSVVHKAYQQVRDTGKVQLFKSDHPDYKDGEQKRDFVYVKDAVDMTLYFLDKPEVNGLFNVGTGKAKSWNDLVTALFKAMDKPVNIEYIDMPEHLKGKYQYFTEAKMEQLKNTGYSKEVTSLEDAVKDYVQNYLQKEYPYLAW
ncbi:MAG: ADP-glyceromanno-heptose 6-epimerase [Bacteroidetes bacterium]|nr:ADP-glyceromanno-heptose 6-epimerase [Bacteroidota bacterium]